MQRSTDRILTTHAGSLPRPKELVRVLVQRDQKRDYDAAELARLSAEGVHEAVSNQLDAGLDIVNDGEAPRVGFSTYVSERMTGFGGAGRRKPTLDTIRYPEYAAQAARQIAIGEEVARVWDPPMAQTALHYDDALAGITADLDLFAAELDAQPDKPAGTFFTAASPGIVTTTLLRDPENPDYRTDRDYVFGVAEELRKEYEAIVAAGHTLQLDAPDLAMERVILYGDEPTSVFLDALQMHIEAMNHALRNIPPEKVRLHVCWGNWQGPHEDDIPAAEILPYIYEAKVGALSIPFANPQHQHEVDVFRTLPLPDHMILIPGVIDVTTNYLEHPEVVARRLVEVAESVGDPTRIIAGCDCGLETFASYEFVARDVVWAKLRSLVAGAGIASRRLFA